MFPLFFFLMIRRPPRSTLDRSSAASDVYKRQGYCSGIENYSRFFDRRKAGDRPFCLLDYFPDDFLLIVDESHVTIPQVSAMYGGCLLYTSPSPRDRTRSRMPSSA